MSFPLFRNNDLSEVDRRLFELTEAPQAPFAYSDGRESEQYLEHVLKQARDVSTLSPELRDKIVDWPSEYHLSGARANLLRPFDLDGMDRVLEIGCGCGAISRYLGELGLNVDAVEGSETRARLAAERCRDLATVNIVCANFNDLTVPESAYDAVLLIGVTEYAARFCPGVAGSREAVLKMLDAARRALRSGGVVVIAIENRIGLKYIFGAHEDHYGKPYIGIHDYPGDDDIRTYSRREWQGIIDDAGFQAGRFFFPFPDYKLPAVILSEDYALRDPNAYCHLENVKTVDRAGPLLIDYPEFIYWQAFAEAKALDRFANSYLIALSDSQASLDGRFDIDFAHLPGFTRRRGMNRMVRKRRGAARVERHRLDEDDGGLPAGIEQHVENEPYFEGRLLSVEWSRSLMIHENSDAFENLLRKYYQFLEEYGPQLPIDLIPCNVIVTAAGEYRDFDQEWRVAEPVDARYVFFRALVWFATWYHPKAALRILRRCRNIQTLGDFIRYGFSQIGESRIDDLEQMAEREHRFQSAVKRDQASPLDFDELFVSAAPPPPIYPRVYWKAHGEEYAESRTVVLSAETSPQRQTLVFELPVSADQIHFIRFDPFEKQSRPMDDLGYLHLYGIEVQLCNQGYGEPFIAMSLKGAEEIAANTVQSGMRFHSTSMGSVFLVNDEDPWLDFRLTFRRAPEPGQRVRVVLDLRLACSPDYLLAHDAYLVREEAYAKKQRQLQGAQEELESLRAELATLKSGKAWRAVDAYRRVLHGGILPRLATVRRYLDLVKRQGPAAAWRQGSRAALRRMRILRGKPVTPQDPPTHYEVWLQKQSFDTVVANPTSPPTISIVMPVYNTDPELLQRAIASVRAQTYPHWELCIADDCSTNRATKQLLAELDAPNIKVQFLERNLNISGASNAAAKLASGDYLALLDHDDELADYALATVAATIVEQDPDIVYSDEDFITPTGHLDSPHFKPDYSPELLFSHNYITHLLVLKRRLFDEIGGFRTGYDGAQDYDLVLRAVEKVAENKIAHITKPLYHWRMSLQSTSLNPTIKPEAHDCARRALTDALQRLAVEGVVEDTNLPHYFRVRRKVLGKPKVSIVLPFKDKPGLLADCIGSVLERTSYDHFEIVGVSNDTTTPSTLDLMHELARHDSRVGFHQCNDAFNFSRLVNYGVQQSGGDHIVLLNNDIEIITGDWLQALLEHSQRDEIAAVGGKLYYPDNTIQHAGVAIGLGGYAGHLHKDFPASSAGYFNRLQLIQNVSAVTGALMMYSRAVHDALGGFNETEFAIAYNDVDFCLRAVYAGWRNVFTPYVEAYHHESVSRGYEVTQAKQQRFRREMDNLVAVHGDALRRGDPYYNPNFDQGLDDFSLKQ